MRPTQPFGDWLDMIAGRMLQLFYRAWADSQPAAICDRPDADTFAHFLSALSGVDGRRGRRQLVPAARPRALHPAVHLGARSAAAIEDSLGHLLGQKVRLLEFQPRWRTLEDEDRSRLGSSYCSLGGDIVLGSRVRSASDAFRVLVRADDMRAYRSTASGRRTLRNRRPGARFCSSPDISNGTSASRSTRARSCRRKLDGRAQLGWTGWVGKSAARKRGRDDTVRSDAHLKKMRRKKRGTSQ